MMSLLIAPHCSLLNPSLAAWLHTLDPFLLKFPEGWPLGGLRWYGLAYLAAFALAWLIMRRVTRVGTSPLPTERVTDFVVAVAIGVVVGGRLGYVLFYQPSLLTETLPRAPFWGVLAINQGGMASHGGMAGAFLGCAWFAWRNKLPVLHLFDLIAFAAPLGLFIGRIANFINGELYGRRCAEDFPLAVKFPQELLVLPPEEAARLYAQHAPFTTDADAYTPYAWFGTLLDRVQGFAGPEAQREATALIEPWLTPRHPSQLYAAVLEGLVTFAVLLWVYRGPVKPGVVAAWFAMVYAPMRILNEQFRLPDEHLGFQALGLTRGQWLSVALFIAGIALWAVARRRKVEPLGGWQGGDPV